MEREDAALSGVAHLMVVQREDVDRFRFLGETFRGHPVEIIWDRRIVERRQSTTLAPVDRRSRDRRRAPPASWVNLGFLVARAASARDPA